MKTSTRPSMALIGCGAWGSNWARVLDQLELLAVTVDTRPEALGRIQKNYPHVRAEASLSSVALDPLIEAVVIATPAPTHFEMTRLFLQAGKHVLVEKPLAFSLAQGRELVDLANQKGRILMVGHLFEHHPAIVKLGELIRAGELGQIQYLYSHQLNIGTFRAEENALWSLAPHDVGLILRLLDRMPEEVRAEGAAYLNPRIQDLALLHLKFPGAVRAHVFVDWLHPFKERRLVITGDRQMAVFDDTRPWGEKLTLYPHTIEASNVSGQAPRLKKSEGVRVALTEREPLALQAEHFWACVRGGNEPLTSGLAALRVLEVLEAADLSLRRSENVICLERVQ